MNNTAAWLTGAKVRPLKVQAAPFTPPASKEIVVKNAAVAINPVDYLKQDLGNFLFNWIKYPFVLGQDVAGEVVQVGADVKTFKTGDRVLGHAVGADPKRNKASEGGFQQYTVLLATMAATIPDKMSYEQAAVIPLGFSTAACGFYEKDQLGLPYPSLTPEPSGKTIVVWGASTSVGCNAVQLAVASGFEVVATSSPRNFDLIKRLGASQVFDYKSETVVQDMIRALQGKNLGGAMSIGLGAADACVEILRNCKGDKALTMVSFPMPDPMPKSFVLFKIITGYISWNVVHFFKTKLYGIESSFVFGSSLASNEVGKIVYEDFLTAALASASFVPAPEPQVVGHGLEKIQSAMDFLKEGVSATKVVVTL